MDNTIIYNIFAFAWLLIGYTLGRLTNNPGGFSKSMIDTAKIAKDLLPKRRPKGVVLTEPTPEEELRNKERKKRDYLQRAAINPLEPLPDGLTSEDFDIEPEE